MQAGKQLFDAIYARLFEQDRLVELGLMMNAPALTYRGRAFAFLTKDDRMVFRLEDYRPEPDSVRMQPTALAGWFAVSPYESHHWESLVWKSPELVRDHLG